MREKELRLGLICYGGVSLAVYMHGITREIWHLVRASRNFHDENARQDGSQGIYRDLFEEIFAHGGTKMRVLTDIVAGSSAGGINAIFLSQAIVTGQSLEPLTDLWLEKADVETLLDPDARPISRFTKFWAAPLAWLVLRRKGGAIERNVPAEARAEVASKLSHFIRARWFAPPFGGEVFSCLLFDALDAMAKGGDGPSLLPENQPLDLFVTVTDFAGHDQFLHLNSPPIVVESEHRITISFSTRGRPGNDLAEIAELAFAARATASFPGAFPPFSARELDHVIARRHKSWTGREAFLKRILPQQYAQGVADDVLLIDGSVLANAPFNQAIGALRNRPARREIDRRFVYIDPKPGRPSFRFRGKQGSMTGVRTPGWFSTIFGASSDIPREQPIRDSLDKIEGRSERIARMRMVTDSLHVEIEQRVEEMLGKTWFLSKPTPARIGKWRATANKKASQAAGYSYPAYGHLKIVGVVDDIVAIAKRACQESPPDHFRLMRDAIWAELRKNGLDHMTDEKGAATAESIRFFREHDIRYRIRRLRFLARRLADEIEESSNFANPESQDGVDELRNTIYECLSLFLTRETASHLGEDFTMAVRNGVRNTRHMINMLAEKRDLIVVDQQVDRMLNAAFCKLAPEPRRIMLLGYLGYPLYDIATLPLLQGEGLDEFDPVKVDRISPEDCNIIRKGGAAATLKGIEFNNFGAFFSRTYRENDYLWGRLHGADRLIDIIISAMPEGLPIDDAKIRNFKKRAFHAILDQEVGRLNKIGPLIHDLRAEIDAI